MIDASDLTPASGTLYVPIHEEIHVLWLHSNQGLDIRDSIEKMILEKAVEAKVWKKEQSLYLKRTLHFPYHVPSN
jgi:hypothetical protein